MIRTTTNGMTVSWRHGCVLLSMLMMMLVAACQQDAMQEFALEDDVTSGEYDVVAAGDLDTGLAAPANEDCRHNNDCLDGDGSTIDWCYQKDCHHEKRWECEENGSHCNHHNDCLDGESETLDWCHQHTCHHVERDSGDCA